MRKYESQQRNAFRENAIHVGTGFVAKERSHVVDTVGAVRTWESGIRSDVDLEFLQDRGGKEQRVTLRTTLPGYEPLIAVAENSDINHALSEVKSGS